MTRTSTVAALSAVAALSVAAGTLVIGGATRDATSSTSASSRIVAPGDASQQSLSRPQTPEATARTAAGDDGLAQSCTGNSFYVPTYLPASVSPVPTALCGSHTVLLQYRLLGEPNVDTLPPGGVPTAEDGSQHPPSVLNLNVLDDPTGQGPENLQSEFYSVTRKTLASGLSVQISVPYDGYGPYRVEWTTAGKLVGLYGDRGKTDKARSGLAIEQVLRIADSVLPVACNVAPVSDHCPTRDGS